jgi:hypothetical protein
MTKAHEKNMLSRHRVVGGRRHGKVSTYAHGCKCVLCKAAHSAYVAEFRRKAVAARFVDADGNLCAPVPEHMHGRLSTYGNRSCRCTRCHQARSDYHYRMYGPARQKLAPEELARLRRSVGLATDTSTATMAQNTAQTKEY